MQIAICDDDRQWYDKAKNIIIRYAARTALEVEVLYFESGEALLEYTGAPLEILFLDIEMGKKDGIEIARAVNQKWPACQVVYLTNYLFYATEVYQTEHIFFVLKEQFEQKIAEVMNKMFHAIEQTEKKLLFPVIGSKNVVLAPEDILYFERTGRVTRIETVWGQYEIWDKLDQVEEMLPALDFARCHNSFIVYLPAVREMQKNTFIMKNDMRIVISRTYLKTVKEKFMRWAMTQIS